MRELLGDIVHGFVVMTLVVLGVTLLGGLFGIFLAAAGLR